MIIVDESDPVDELEPAFPYRDVTIRRDGSIRDSYEILDEIGRGKFGRVYRCRDKITGLTLAAKVVTTKKREEKRNVEREVEIMKILQHPRLIQLFDAIEDVNRTETCLVLEMVGGGELFDRVIQDDFVLSERACAVFIRQICEALEYIHSKSIIHLDMKPENVMCLSKNGNRIKIIDFGLARFYDPKKKLQVLFGTPDFVSPECVSFEEITLSADLWSVGVITYVLLSGLSPFMGETDVQTMTNVTIGKYDFDDDAFDDISDDARDFISKLLVKDKSSRLLARECLNHRWLLPSSWFSASPSPQPITNHTITGANDGEQLLIAPEKIGPKKLTASEDGTCRVGIGNESFEYEHNFNGKDDSSDISSSSCSLHSSSSPVPSSPHTASTKPKAASPGTKDCTLRKESLDLTKEQLRHFVSNWADNPYLFDSHREIISHVCSSSSSSSPSPPPPHHFDQLRKHSHKLTVDDNTSNSSPGVNKIKKSNIIVNSNCTNNNTKTSNCSSRSTVKPTNHIPAFERGVNIVSQIRRFSYHLQGEMEFIKTNNNTKTSNSTVRKCPVNVK